MSEEKWSVLETLWWLLVAVHGAAAGLACLNNPCFHGICIDDINSTFACYCVDGYTGVQCQTNWDECWSSPCHNGGTCIDGIASYNCSCPEGFIGDNCETNYNECESNPCLNNGTCIDMTNGYACSCVLGFTGRHCEVDATVCNATGEVRCHNGGECIEGPGLKFYCKCLQGWAGSKCEDQIDECQSNPCKNGGICIDAHADYMCACTYGFTGKSCEVQIEFCDENSCSENALCVVEDGIRVCYCVPDYHGERCELQYDECLLGPRCMNGGTCIDGVDNFTCSCPPNLTGTLCECLILDDGSQNCEYVSPTPLATSTQTLLISTLSEEITSTTEITTSTETTENNKSTGILVTTSKITTSSSPFTIITEMTTEVSSTEIILDTSTSSKSIKDLPKITTTSTTAYDSTTISQVPITVSPIVTETIGSDNYKPEVATVCSGTCTKATESTLESTTGVAIDTTTTTTTTTPLISTINLATVKKDVNTVTEIIKKEDITETPHSILTTTKEVMFTSIPTEHSVTEKNMTIISAVTDTNTTPYMTTEAYDLTTIFDNTTTLYTTTEWECTSSICNNHGTCANTLHGVRCHCTFKYSGRFCEDKISVKSAAFNGNSFISHKLLNTTTLNIEFKAKTFISDGQLMYVDIAKDVYMQLYMKSGLLKFKFSCGYQTMLLSELKTFVNKGYSMKIETRLDLYLKEQHCNATLRLNDTVAMSGGQVANISTVNRNITLYLGSIPLVKELDSKPFIGCIQDLTVNGETREIFEDAIEAGEVSECISLSCLSAPCHNGGSCSDSSDGYMCSCANGWMGEHCNKSVCDHNPCQSGGSCVPHPGSGFLCLCPYGKHGIFCEYNVEITRPSLAPLSSEVSSYLVYPLSPTAQNSDRFDLRLRFQPADVDQIALLMFVGQNGHHDSRSQHLALTFVKGYIMLTWNMGTGPRRVFTSLALGARRGGHTVRVWRRGRSAGFSVDGRHNASGNAPAHDTKMTLLPYVYIGGHSSLGFRDLPHDLPLHSGWRGCIWEVGGQAVTGGKPVAGRGIGQCGVVQCTAKSCNAPRGVCIHSPATYGCICEEGWFGVTCSGQFNPCDSSRTQCRGRCVLAASTEPHCDCPYGKTGKHCEQELVPTDVLFTGRRSFVRLHPQLVSSVTLALEAEIKPARERGLVVFTHTPHFYTALSLQGGLLEYRWTDHLSGLTSLVRSGVVLSLGQWHKVKAGRYGGRLYTWVDGALSTEPMLAYAYPHTTSNATIQLGGAEDLASLPFDAISGPPQSYSGCIRNFHLNNILLPMESQNIQEGQNLADCDGTPCGDEACSGGPCVVESGSARCRRYVSCDSTWCVAPRGRCRRGRCICAIGYTGLDCQTNINVTVPQFDGDSVLSLTRRNSGGQQNNEQRLATATPTQISFNFTTAEADGLLLWMKMGKDFLGIGLEKGYLKLMYSFRHRNDSAKSKENINVAKIPNYLSKTVSHAGFLANGEWHLLTLRLKKAIITLNVDMLLNVEETQIRNGTNFDDVDIYLGGIIEEEGAISKKVFPKKFKGCIDYISIEDNVYITNYTDMYSENIGSCPLIPFT